jgi:circadian clock protein KaiB
MSLEQHIASANNGQGPDEMWNLRLYVAGSSAKSVTAAQNLKRLCEKYLPGRYTIELVDLLKHPERAQKDQILAIPTLVRSVPSPVKKVIGDLSNTERALVSLEIVRGGEAQ